jgi:hypothetical protein
MQSLSQPGDLLVNKRNARKELQRGTEIVKFPDTPDGRKRLETGG